jgi:hypothetical protein
LLFYVWGVPDALRTAAFSLLACMRFPFEGRLELILFNLVGLIAIGVSSFSLLLKYNAKSEPKNQ